MQPFLKTTLTISLAFLFLVQSFTRTFIIINYKMNKDYIAKTLCENKKNKTMHCEGRCHLKKELQKEEKKENVPASNGKEKFETTLFNSLQNQEFVFEVTLPHSLFSYTLFLSEEHLIPVFHPPGCNA